MIRSNAGIVTRKTQRRTPKGMPAKNSDLHGNAPDQSPVALVLIDVINDLEFPGGERLLEPALAAAERIAALKRRAYQAGIPVIYANDNFGRWRSDFREVIERCLSSDVRGQPVVRRLQPEPDDYFVLKPKHSAFFSTTLEMLLTYLGARHLILAGIRGDSCVLLTAGDAYMRDLHLHVPSDCSVSMSEEENRQALDFMERVLKADLTASTELDLQALKVADAE
jgi:nicotinamidase-related amidase